MISKFERLKNALSRYTETEAGSAPEAAARLLGYYIGGYRSRETAIELANRELIKHGLELIDVRTTAKEAA
jgi:hypothetical protein